MPLQTQNLVMIGLGVQGDSPPNGLQPPLVDGVHLRWAFKRDLGFPWYGFYLFRRPHQRGKPTCLSPILQSLAAPPTGSSRITTAAGEISSDQNLVLTDNFPPSGAPEFDLAGRRYLRLTLPTGEVANLAEIRVGFRQNQASPGTRTSITITALLGDQPVGKVAVSGQAGQIATASIAFDAISAIELTSGPAALVDLCYVPVSQNAAAGWTLIPEFQYPLCLPITHPDYPCSGNGPVNLVAAEARALGRVVYGPPGTWAGTPFAELHEQLVHLVEGGPGSIPMASRTLPAITATPVPPDPDLAPPRIPNLAPLDLVLLSSLHPAMAQMVGLYWVDRKAPPGVAFDYLIVADYSGRGREPNKLLSLIQQNGFADVEGYIVFDIKQEPAAPLPPPDGLRAYALPGSTRRMQGGGLEDASNNAGLRWNLGVNLGILQPGHSIMYHIWRAGLGDANVPATPGTYDLLTKDGAVLVAEPHIPPGILPERAGDWPPFPLHYIDSQLKDGWYGYQVSGVDIFGRHSPNSAAAAWYEWKPVPDPRPWYYQDPPADIAIHPSAIRLLDKVSPPPPTGVEAYALDPADPTGVKDAAYDAWWSSLSPTEQSSVVGLRVRWLWTDAHQRQAPDTREFRIYYDPGRPNALVGRTGSVTPVGAAESDVETDIANSYPADACAGTWLRIAGHSFPVIGSQAGSPLHLRVRNLGLTYTAGTVSVTNGSAEVAGVGMNWHAGMAGRSLQVGGEAPTYTILSVQSPTQLTLSRLYEGATGGGKSYTIFDVRPGVGALCTLVIPPTYGAGMVAVVQGSPIVSGTGTNWNATLVGQTFRAEGNLARFTILAVNSPSQITLDRDYSGPSSTGKAYTISHPLFTDYTSPTNWEERYYVVGFDDHVTVTTDAAGLPLRSYEVLLPAPGDAFRGGVPLATSPAEPIAYALVGVSAADDKLHTADAAKWAAGRWGDRPGNEGSVGPPAVIFRVHREPPPAPEPPPDAERVFATPADYHSHSFYTYRWRPSAHLKTHIFRALDDAVFKADWAQRPRPALDASQPQFFPDEAAEPRWNAAKRQQVATELNQVNGFSHDAAGTRQAMAFYRQLSNDALRVLAGLPGNDRAFAQLTIQPLDPDDPANANRLGPDNPPGFVVDPALRAYVDTLDGRSTNRYFYRSAYVDGAHNRGPLSGSGPPIWLPNVVPPRAPVLTKALGGDRQIVLRWTSNREPDLVEYRVYRTDQEQSARDLRMMTLVHTETVPAGDPIARPAEVAWIDSPVPGRVTLYYRLVAVDDAGNVSDSSQLLVARAFDESRPAPPIWSAPITGAGSAVQLSWTSPISDLRCLVQRHIDGATTWENASNWLPRGVYSYDDQNRLLGLQYVYRLQVMDTAGRTNNAYNELTV